LLEVSLKWCQPNVGRLLLFLHPIVRGLPQFVHVSQNTVEQPALL